MFIVFISMVSFQTISYSDENKDIMLNCATYAKIQSGFVDFDGSEGLRTPEQMAHDRETEKFFDAFMNACLKSAKLLPKGSMEIKPKVFPLRMYSNNY